MAKEKLFDVTLRGGLEGDASIGVELTLPRIAALDIESATAKAATRASILLKKKQFECIQALTSEAPPDPDAAPLFAGDGDGDDDS